MLRQEGLLPRLRRLSVTGRDHGAQRREAEEWGGQVLEKSPLGTGSQTWCRGQGLGARQGAEGRDREPGGQGARTEIKGGSGGF